MNVKTRIGWTMWALVPVGLIAFHFGPGERLAARDQAVRLHSHAVGIEERAAFLQAAAHATQLDVIRLRRASFLEDGSDVADDLADALRVEREAYEVAAEAWQEAADAFSAVEDSLRGNNDPDAVNIRWSKARAQVRAGDIWGGAEEFEVLLDELDPKSELSRATREELARAHYFGARLLRENGEPAEEWRPEVIKARQHFRLLAERAARSGASESVIRGLEDNVERGAQSGAT